MRGAMLHAHIPVSRRGSRSIPASALTGLVLHSLFTTLHLSDPDGVGSGSSWHTQAPAPGLPAPGCRHPPGGCTARAWLDRGPASPLWSSCRFRLLRWQSPEFSRAPPHQSHRQPRYAPTVLPGHHPKGSGARCPAPYRSNRHQTDPKVRSTWLTWVNNWLAVAISASA